jgi:hypothetical protein
VETKDDNGIMKEKRRRNLERRMRSRRMKKGRSGKEKSALTEADVL